jgi:hypothetical protein
MARDGTRSGNILQHILSNSTCRRNRTNGFSYDDGSLRRRANRAGQFGAQEVPPLPHRNPALQQESAYLIDDGGALAD